MNHRITTLASLVGLALVSSGAFGLQPEAAPSKPERSAVQNDRREPIIDRDRLRARLERRLAEYRRFTAELEAGIARLNDGAPPGEVAAALESLAQSIRPGEALLRDRTSQEGPGTRGGPPRDRSGPEGDRAFPDREGRPRDGAIEPVRLLEILKEASPEFAARIETLRGTDPEAADRMIGRMGPRLREALQAREQDPELFRLRVNEIRSGIELFDAARAYGQAVRSADPAAITAAESSLTEAANTHFDVRVAMQEREMQSLAARIEELRAELDRKKSERQSMVDGFVEHMKRKATDDKPRDDRQR